MDIQKEYNIQAKKSLWQNFLEDEGVLDTIAWSTQIQGENIIEVGPWYWALTCKILKEYPESLWLIELDQDMVDILYDRHKKEWWGEYCDDFRIKNIDVLEEKDMVKERSWAHNHGIDIKKAFDSVHLCILLQKFSPFNRSS